MMREKTLISRLILPSMAAILLTACSHVQNCPPYPAPSMEARQEMVQGFLDGEGNFKPEWRHTEEWLGRIEKMKRQLK